MSDDDVLTMLVGAQTRLYDAVIYAIASDEEYTMPQAHSLLQAYLAARRLGDQWEHPDDVDDIDEEVDRVAEEVLEEEVEAEAESLVEEMKDEANLERAREVLDRIENSRFARDATVETLLDALDQFSSVGYSSRSRIVGDIKQNVIVDAEFCIAALFNLELIEEGPCNGYYGMTTDGRAIHDHREELLDSHG